jgi:hypothetical protein
MWRIASVSLYSSGVVLAFGSPAVEEPSSIRSAAQLANFMPSRMPRDGMEADWRVKFV